MMLFLYGEESFEISQKLSSLTTDFLKSNSNGSSFEIRDFSENENIQNLESLLNSQGLFSEKKMIILKNIFTSLNSEKQKEIKNILKNANSSDIIIICEYNNPRKNSILYKWLLVNASEIIEYRKLNDKELVDWIKCEFNKYNAEISINALNYLILSVGNDLYKLNSEIKKLVNYTLGREIKKENIELLISKDIDANIFDTVKDMMSENKLKALSGLKKQIASGDSPNKIHGMYSYQIRTMIAIMGEYENGILDKNAIAKSIKLHPYVVQKALLAIKRLDKKRLFRAHTTLLEIYANSKIGKFDMQTALEIFVMEF